MKWYKFWAKDSEAVTGKKVTGDSVDPQLLNADFFCQLTYMAAIATSSISRSGLFYRAAKLPYVSARYFQKVDFVAKAFNHDYSEACRIVGQSTKEPEVKAVLLRLSGALSSGENIATFLEQEAEVASETYGNHYERSLEVLRKWTDAYIALIMTSAIVTVMAVVTIIMGNITTAFLLGMTTLTVIVTIAGVWLIHRSAPREVKVHSLPVRSREQALAKNIAPLTLVMGVLIILVTLVTKAGLGWAMLAAGIFLLPVGFIGRIDDRKIDKRDFEIAGFLRSLGGVSQAVGATVNESMGRLDFRSLGSLKDDINLLYNRLLAGITPDLCWERFAAESGSEQVNRSVRIFWDAVTLGGEPERVGGDVSTFAMKISLLRAKRGLIVSGMSWLNIAMHIVLTVLVVFVYHTLITFSGLIQEALPQDATSPIPGLSSFGMFSGGAAGLNLLYFMVIVIVIVLTIANAFAIYATSGGHIFKLAFYLAITASISGLTLIFVPSVVSMMFGGIGV